MEIKGKTFIVTGAGSGIGKEITIQIIKKGGSVAAVDINSKSLELLKSELKKCDNLTTHVLDMSKLDTFEGFRDDFYKEHKVIDGLINNAGIIQPFVKLENLDLDIANKIMDVNFNGPLKLTKMFLKDLMKRPEANITNISSMGGFFPFPGQTVYGASKAALKILTEGLYAEMLDTNVNVMVVFPGAIATNIAANSNIEISQSNNSKIKALPAKEAAFQIIEGIEKNKFSVYVGKDSKMMNILYKLNPAKAIKIIKNKMKDLISKD